MATISLTEKELDAIYFLIETQDSVLEDATDNEYIEKVREVKKSAYSFIEKYKKAKAKETVKTALKKARKFVK